MGQEIVYCSGCGARIVTADFEKGGAVRHGNRTACSRCAPDLFRGVDAVGPMGPAVRPVLPPTGPPPRRGPPSSTRLPAPPSSGAPARVGWGILGALAGAAAFAGLWALSSGGRSAPAPASAVHRPPPPAPVPAVVAKPAPPTPEGKEAAALEREMAAAMEKQKRERFTRFLEEIRGKMAADPGLSQQTEIERMLDVAAAQAGGRLPEVLTLRSEYARNRERARREAGLAGLWPLDEGGGEAAKDASGRGHDGSLVSSGVRWTAGRTGGGLAFDGSGQGHVRLPATDALCAVQEGSYTLAAWYKPESVPPKGKRHGLLIRPGFHLGLSYSSEQQFHMDHWVENGNAGTRTTGDPYPPGRFYLVVGVVDRDSGTTRIYVDGRPGARRPWAAGAAARAFGRSSWLLGIASLSNPEFRWAAHGVIDDVRIYGRALGAEEVAELGR